MFKYLKSVFLKIHNVGSTVSIDFRVINCKHNGIVITHNSPQFLPPSTQITNISKLHGYLLVCHVQNDYFYIMVNMVHI